MLCCPGAYAMIAGHIIDDAGRPVAGARVFAEPGVEGALVEGAVLPDGTFNISGEFFGNVGVFALAPGHGYGGRHLNIAAGDEPNHVEIKLAPETQIGATVADARGNPLSGVRVTSIALTHPSKVGIPVSKLSAFGQTVPSTNASGRVTVPMIPSGAVIALKFEHHMHAQEAITDIAAGTSDTQVTMHRGVSVRGKVVIRGTDTPVSGATITARNAQPPHDTAICATDGTGIFSTRLKPGVYLFQAYGAGRISPGLQRFEVTGESPEQTLRLSLSETGIITGAMNDARTGQPIPGIRVLLETMGHAAAAARTGPDGRFRLKAAAGANTLYFESMEGYMPPDTRALRVTVPAGDTLELPGMWLAPAPVFTLRVVEDDGETLVPGAFIALLHPRQFGWQRADAQGRATLRFSALPEDNRIIGFAEHPQKDYGALFSMDHASTADAVVALLPLARVEGRVVNRNGAPVPGAAVGAFFADDALPEALPVWRCFTDNDGYFLWPAAPAGVPQRCIATQGAGPEIIAKDINPAPREHIDLGTITLAADISPAAMPSMSWLEQPWLCGPQAETAGKAGIVVFHCRPGEAAVYTDASAAIRELLHSFNIETLVAVTADYDCETAAVPVYRSPAHAPATTVHNQDGIIRLSLTGLPPLALLRQLDTE